MRKNTLEATIRALDDETLTVAASARRIARLTDAKIRTITVHLSAKRNGKTYGEYLSQLAHGRDKSLSQLNYKRTLERFGNGGARTEFYANQRGFDKARDYWDAIAKRKYGFQNAQQLTAFKAGRPIPKVHGKHGPKYVSPEKLDALPEQDRDYLAPQQEARRLVSEAMLVLNPKQKKVIHARYYQGKTLEETAPLIGMTTGERVRQIEAAALIKMRDYINWLNPWE